MSSALVICAGGGAGDVLLATPVMRALRARYDRVIALTASRHRDVLAGNPDLSDVWTDDRSLLAHAQRIRAERFAVAVVTWSTGRYALLPLLGGVPLRAGQARRLHSVFYNRRVRVKSEFGDHSTHWTQILLDYARAFGCEPRETTPVVPPIEAAAAAAVRELLIARGITNRYGVLHPTRGVDLHGRTWPVATLAALATRLQERFALPIVITGTAADAPIAEAIAAGSETVSLAGATSFPQLAALLGQAAFCVAVDSGPMHVAAALGTPTVGIFALSTDEPQRWAPLGAHSAVVTGTYQCPAWHRKENCPDFACLRELPLEAVMTALAGMLPAADRVP